MPIFKYENKQIEEFIDKILALKKYKINFNDEEISSVISKKLTESKFGWFK